MTLKQRSRIRVYVLAVLNVLIWLVAAEVPRGLAAFLGTLAGDASKVIPAGAGTGAVGVLVVGVLVEVVPTHWKDVLVFWRLRDPLPGTRAFTSHLASDPRVDQERIAARHGPLPTEARAQNALWYRIYRSVGEAPEVQQAHGQYLFGRDATVLAVLVLVVFGGAACFLLPACRRLAVYLAFLLVQVAVLSQVARNAGVRFVTTVLAIASHT